MSRHPFHGSHGPAAVVGDMTAFELLARPLQKLVEARGWQPTPVQTATIEPLLAGEDSLVVAPTGSGKTEAVVLPLLSRALAHSWQPMAILYVTPLRALNRDIDRRIADLAKAAGLTADLRHGDTSQYHRTRQSKNPPHLLVTTPETTQLLLLGSRLREGLRNLRAVVIDEVHELASSERGSQLLVALERIDELCGRKVQRIGLSATIGNPEEMARWLSPNATPVLAPSPRGTDLEVVTEPVTDADRALSLELHVSPQGLAALRRLATRIRESAPCLVFVNSRNTAETVAQRIQRLDPDMTVGVHHGSLAAETRQQMEQDLQEGTLHGLICTSSLELGIDVGSVNEVHQLQSPRAVDRMLQRVGRADHVLGGTGRGMLLCWEPDEIAEAAVIARRAMAGDIEGVEWRRHPRTVAANQLILTALAERVVPLAAGAELLRRCDLFSELTDDETLSILRILHDRWLLRVVEDPEQSDPLDWPPALWEEIYESTQEGLPEKKPKKDELAGLEERVTRGWQRALSQELPERFKGGWFSPGPRARTYLQKHLSMIADETKYAVRDAVTRRMLGNVDETFVLSLDDSGAEEDGTPRRFVMAGRTWEVVDADSEKVELLVAPVSEQGDAPVWAGELPPVPADIAREAGAIRIAVARSHGWSTGLEESASDEPRGPTVGLDPWLTGDSVTYDLDDYPLSSPSLARLAESVAEHIEASGCLPHARLLTLEQRRDAIVLNSTHGSRINETLAHFLQAMASNIEGRVGRVLVDPYRITLQVPGLTPAGVVEWLTETPPEALDDLVRLSIPNGRQLRARLVQVCKVFGVLHAGVDPRKVNLGGILTRYRGTPLVDEALDKLFSERMDIDGTTDLLRAIQAGAVELRLTAPGALGISPRGQRDLLLPNWSAAEVRERLKNRLVNERVVLVCLRCKDWMRFRVERYAEKHHRCACGGTMLACAREGLEARLKEWVADDEPAVRNRMQRNAELVQLRGKEAILCLLGRGVGPDTATRILRKVPAGDEDMLLKAIHEAELQYARTRRFWG